MLARRGIALKDGNVDNGEPQCGSSLAAPVPEGADAILIQEDADTGSGDHRHGSMKLLSRGEPVRAAARASILLRRAKCCFQESRVLDCARPWRFRRRWAMTGVQSVRRKAASLRSSPTGDELVMPGDAARDPTRSSRRTAIGPLPSFVRANAGRRRLSSVSRPIRADEILAELCRSERQDADMCWSSHRRRVGGRARSGAGCVEKCRHVARFLAHRHATRQTLDVRTVEHAAPFLACPAIRCPHSFARVSSWYR